MRWGWTWYVPPHPRPLPPGERDIIGLFFEQIHNKSLIDDQEIYQSEIILKKEENEVKVPPTYLRFRRDETIKDYRVKQTGYKVNVRVAECTMPQIRLYVGN